MTIDLMLPRQTAQGIITGKEHPLSMPGKRECESVGQRYRIQGGKMLLCRHRLFGSELDDFQPTSAPRETFTIGQLFRVGQIRNNETMPQAEDLFMKARALEIDEHRCVGNQDLHVSYATPSCIQRSSSRTL